MELNLALIFGFLGMLLILTGFTANQLHRLERDSLLYDSLNLMGSGLLVAYAFSIRGYPFAVLNGVWFLVSLHDLILDLKKK